MSVVHVLDVVQCGHGRSITALSLAEAQHRAGWDVRLLVCGVRSPELVPRSVPARPLLDRGTAAIYRDVTAIDPVRVALEGQTDPGDTVVCHDGVSLAAVTRMSNRRVVAAVHSDPAQCLGYLPHIDMSNIRDATDKWVAWGAVIAEQLSTSFQVDPHRIIVSAQAVNPGRPAARTLLGSPCCISVARIHPVKNHPLMLETLPLLADSFADIHWHMVGGWQDEAYLRTLQKQAARLGVGHLITWHGYRRDVAEMMLGSDVAVLASHSEGVPRAVQEAMALGVPTVMPAAFAADVSHEGLPVTYCRQAPRNLAAAIETALHVDTHRLSAAASWVTRRWGWEAVLSDWKRAVA